MQKRLKRGTLFFSIVKILETKRPKAFVLENVKQLRGYNKGKTLERIRGVLRELGCKCDWHAYNAMDFGLRRIASASLSLVPVITWTSCVQ